MNLPQKLTEKVTQRINNKALRTLDIKNNLIDFSSNDYLGFAENTSIFNNTHHFLINHNIKNNGAKGSRLLSGNYNLYNEVETFLAKFHNSNNALLFNSGYDANIGFFSSVPQRGDIILYDEYSHASIRDGIQLSNAKAFKFKHNNIKEIEKLLVRYTETTLKHTIYVVTESVFSMDGDSPDLKTIAEICNKNNAFLVIDEAHAVGVFNKGLIQELNLEQAVFARIITFGKALGCHGACILGSSELTQYLTNFARSFIYTTGLPPHSLATIKIAYAELKETEEISKLKENIIHFKTEINRLHLDFIDSTSAIHCCIIGGNDKTKRIAKKLQQYGFNVKPILSPTVPIGKERLRFCLHSYNSKSEISSALEKLVLSQ